MIPNYYISIISSILFTICSCSKPETNSKEEAERPRREDPEIVNLTLGGYFPREWTSIHDKHNIDTSRYEKYQLFDFCNLKGIGKVEKEPYVLIRDSAEFKIVRHSEDIYNPYIFQNMGDYWYNYKAFYMELKDGCTLNGPNAAEVHRFVKNGQLFEYYVDLIDPFWPKFRVFNNIYKCHVVSLFPNMKDNLKEYEMTFSANMFDTLQKKYKTLSKQRGQQKRYFVNNYNLIIKYADPYILEYENTLSNNPDIVLYSPLGAIDDDCTKPRCFGNYYALIRDTPEAWRKKRLEPVDNETNKLIKQYLKHLNNVGLPDGLSGL